MMEHMFYFMFDVHMLIFLFYNCVCMNYDICYLLLSLLYGNLYTNLPILCRSLRFIVASLITFSSNTMGLSSQPEALSSRLLLNI